MPHLLEALAPIQTEVIAHSSDPPNPWAGYLLCLQDLPDCSHLLILQDDTRPCQNFAEAVQRVSQTNPDLPVVLFLGKQPRDASALALRAARRGETYIDLPWRGFMPVVAVLWPKHKAEEFAAWAAENPGLPGEREPRSDDAMAGQWKTATRQQVRATVPSLVEHPDEVESLIGKRRTWGDGGRSAMLLAADGLDHAW